MSYWGWQVSVVANIWGILVALTDTTDCWGSRLDGSGDEAGRISSLGWSQLVLIWDASKGATPLETGGHSQLRVEACISCASEVGC
jgi:hypothetical protein